MSKQNALYDLECLRQQTGNDEVFLHSIVVLFIKQTSENLAKINQDIQIKNWPGISFIIHKMKSNIKLFGIPGLGPAIDYLEEASSGEVDEGKVIAQLKNIESVLNECIEQLKQAFQIDS
ncbi:MAG: Hpt domain-containing protein [Bacteroidetes bacterium]|nr:Hpt domain-containing protein [Bacteroidota bacterium]